jgi:DnaJ-class molecular chaperone
VYPGEFVLEKEKWREEEFGRHEQCNCDGFCCFPWMKEEYETLRLSPGATEKDVKGAFRRLALQHHPDVCKGDNCGVQFHKINQAYETVMSSLAQAKQQNGSDDYYIDGMMGINNDSCDEWEDWMGWKGVGTHDYSSHINIYA